MMFDNPFVLTGFLIFVPIFIYDFLSSSRKLKQKLPVQLQKRMTLSVVLFRLFMAFTIIALSGPRWGTGFAALEYRRGLDAVFAIDVSRSMDIRDTQPDETQSRLERGLLIARESVISVPGARFAAAIGRGRGYLAVPLTYDNEAVFDFLQALDGSSMTGRSTNLESLVEAAADTFQTTSVARKVIVLISDGESHSGVLRNAINRCVREGIILTAVAIGSDEGGSILAVPNDPSSSVISRRDAAVMRTAAERTGGIYIDGNRQEAASALSSHLMSLAQEISLSSREDRTESKQRRTLFIVLAIFAYGASKIVLRLPNRLPLVSMFLVVFIFSSCSDGKLILLEANYLMSRGRYDEALDSYQKALNYKDAAPYAQYGLGLTLHSLDESTTALDRYNDSQKMLEGFSDSEHRELRYRNLYNSGIVYFEEGDFNLAADAFKEALRIDPRRVDAKRNLEISLISITMETNTEDRTESRSETREILFDYIRQQEQQHWKSREWAPEERPTVPDY